MTTNNTEYVGQLCRTWLVFRDSDDGETDEEAIDRTYAEVLEELREDRQSLLNYIRRQP